jgi:hypothetical protein
MTIIYLIIAIIILWSAWGYFSSRVEQTPYSVIESKRDYEIRLYPQHLVAQTTLSGEYQQALNEGFRIVAKYIFGANTKQKSIAMTAPAIEASPSSQKIAMTAPVVTTDLGESHLIAFGMPKSYTLATLPQPIVSRVQIVTIPERKLAVKRFGWLRTTARIQLKKQDLLASLKKDNVTTIGQPYYAGYNAPWTPPWLARNEVMVEIN